MSSNNANQKLNDLLLSRDFDIQALDKQGKPAQSPEDAIMYSFDYIGKSGKDYGTVVVTITDDLTVYFGDNIGKSMEQDDKDDWFNFLIQLRQFAMRNAPGGFSTQNLNKLKYSIHGQAALNEGWAGTKNISWNASPTEARLMIKHKKTIGEGDARFRYIDSLFIETAEGERYRMPFKSLSAGRAMLEHVRQGGKPYDARGNHISTIVEELSLLSRFKRANQGKIFEGETAQLVEEATQYYETLQRNLKSLSTKNGYKKYFESWNPAALTDEDVIIEDLRHLFVEQNIDTRIEQALPLLAKLKQEHTMKEANIFESMMNLITEGTWALPDTEEKQQKLIQLLADELPVGADATNATELLYDLLGDDELFDKLADLAQQDANADARTVIIDRLEELKSNPDVAQVIGKLKLATISKTDDEQEVQEAINSYDIDNTPCPKCHEKELTYLQGTNHCKCGACGKSFSLAGKPVNEITSTQTDLQDSISWPKEVPSDTTYDDEDEEYFDPTNPSHFDYDDDEVDEGSDPTKSQFGKHKYNSSAGYYHRMNKQALGKSPFDKDYERFTGISGKALADKKQEYKDTFKEEELDELSLDTLKSYIKKAAGSSDERSASNLASRAAAKLAEPEGDDDGNWDDEKSYLRSKGIGRAVDRLEESEMGRVAEIMSAIARGEADLATIMNHPDGREEEYVSQELHKKYAEVFDDNPGAEYQDIIDRMQRELEVEYGADDNMEIDMDEGRSDFPDETEHEYNNRQNTSEGTVLQGQYGHSGQLQAVKGIDQDMMNRIKFLAGITK